MTVTREGRCKLTVVSTAYSSTAQTGTQARESSAENILNNSENCMAISRQSDRHFSSSFHKDILSNEIFISFISLIFGDVLKSTPKDYLVCSNFKIQLNNKKLEDLIH